MDAVPIWCEFEMTARCGRYRVSLALQGLEERSFFVTYIRSSRNLPKHALEHPLEGFARPELSFR